MFRFPHLLVPGFGAALLFSCSEKEQPREVEVPGDPAAVAPAPASPSPSPSPAAPAAGSGLKIATVDIQELFREYGRTNEAQKEINVERARIQKDSNDRLAHIRELETELQGLRKELEDPSISESKKQTLFNEWSVKQEEGIALDRQRREDMQRRTQSLNEKMVQRMKGLLEEIRKRVEEKAKAEDYDYVFDKSGLSTTQLPLFLFTKGSTDMTRKLLADLNAGSSPPAKAEAGGSAGGDVGKPD